MKRERLTIVLGLLLLGASTLRADLPDGLLGYYPFNGNAEDASGNLHHGTVWGAFPAQDRFGNPGSAYGFGGDDYIIVDDFPDVMDSLTFAAWVYLQDLSAQNSSYRVGGYALCKGKYLVPETYSIVVTQSRLPQVRVNIDGVSGREYVIAEGSQPIPLEVWTHIAGVFDHSASTLELFVDGGSRDIQTAAGALHQNPEALYFGCDYWNALTTWEGGIDGVRIYNRALTEAEVQAVVPAPGAGILGLIGVGMVGAWVRKRGSTDPSR